MSTTVMSTITRQLEDALNLLDKKDGCDDVKGLLSESVKVLSHINQYAALKSSPLSLFVKQIQEDTIALDYDELLKDGTFKTTYGMRSIYGMLTPPGQVRLLQFLVQKFNSKNILEVGTFTGFAAFGMAEVMASGGKVTGIELETAFCNLVNERAKKHNLNVEVKEGKAISVLQSLAREGNQYDLIYIDCVKEEYYDYYKIIMENNMLPPQGIIVCDNVLWRGTSITRYNDTGSIVDDFNTAISQDKRVSSAYSQLAMIITPILRLIMLRQETLSHYTGLFKEDATLTITLLQLPKQWLNPATVEAMRVSLTSSSGGSS